MLEVLFSYTARNETDEESYTIGLRMVRLHNPRSGKTGSWAICNVFEPEANAACP